ncbi:MAG: ABC transporter ATP-binding protein [Cytophagales bacterium]|nr:ABC transporter ATP-binding protein [Cytophagales bacterium]
MRTFLRVIQYGRPFDRRIPLYLLATLGNTIFSVVNISVLIPIIQLLFDEEASPVTTLPSFAFSIGYFQDLFYFYFNQLILESGKIQALYFVCAVLVASFFFSNFFGISAALLQAKVRIRLISNLRKDVFERVSRFDISYFTAYRKGDVISRVTVDMQQVESAVINLFKVFLKEPLMIIAYFVALLTISPKLTLYTLAIIPLSGVAISYLTKKLRKRARLSQDALGGLSSILDEVLSGIRIVKAFAARNYVVDRFNDTVDHYAKHTYKLTVRQSFARPVSEFLGVSFMSLIIIIGGTMVLNEADPLPASSFIGFLVVFSQIITPAKSISNAISGIQRGLVSAERVFELTDSTTKIHNKPDAIQVQHLAQGFSFKKVSFSYEDSMVLHQLNFEINKGKVVALVGPSGGGKSTIADLVPRFYDPIDGEILLDGMNLKDYNLDSLRGMMGIVSQESILFNDTIRNNIAFGKPDASLEKVIKVAQLANAHGFIEEMEAGYDTNIGERGEKLSGGQKQRISIARALLKNPPFLILDEATSALDSASERLVQDALFNLMKDRTTLVIAHRLSTIQSADTILVINEGRIAQMGSHEELVSQEGLYKKLIEMQSF